MARRHTGALALALAGAVGLSMTPAAGAAVPTAPSGAPGAVGAATEALDIAVPEGALTITDGTLTVRTHPDFPQVVDYRLGGKQLAGRLGSALTSITVDGVEQPVTVGTATVSGASVSYPVTFTKLPGASLTAVISVKDGAVTYSLTKIADPQRKLNRISIPDLDLVSVTGDDPKSQIMATKMSINRNVPGDTLITVAGAEEGAGNAWMVTANDSGLAAGFETNAIGDNTVPGRGSNADRFRQRVHTVDGVRVGSVGAAEWTYRGQAVSTYDDGSGIGVDPDPKITVKITADANRDAVVNWQDGALATRDILTPFVGMEDVKNYVVARIPFNIVSQATHPFLRTLDDTKRIALATDKLGQQALLKGYQAEGHDSAQGDYGDNYNERAGGLKDMKTLVSEGKDWNATFGVHVNATESYSEANSFGEDLLTMPPVAGWGWMNQSYKMNNQKDLATNNVFERLAELRKNFPADSNMNWLYWDVYYPRGWEGDRFAAEAQKQGWRISSEWSYAMPQANTWAHWAVDENYGGATHKGINSQLARFVQNSYRDTWNPDPRLGNPNIVEFEGWQRKNDYNAFIKNVWERNLPAKFLQQSDIMRWQDKSITFENGTVVTSPLDTIDGKTVPTNRTITFDGATVYDQGSYLLPWKDGGSDRLYYWNPGKAKATWELTDAWASQKQLTLFKLTDTGRAKVADVPVTGGKVSLPATEADTAYVLYPTSKVPAAQAPNWGEGSGISDPGFFSGTLDAYRTSGSVKVVRTDRGNFQAELGPRASSVGQQLRLPAGSYSAWAWVEIEPGKTRTVSVRATGDVAAQPTQGGHRGQVATTITSSSAINATASDEKKGTYFQRVPIRFTTRGGPVNLTVRADAGAAKVSVDDLRVVPWTAPAEAGAVPGTVAFEDFENVDTGYWPFVTGSRNAGGDARTQLAKRHEPYSQSGWYGLVNGGGSTAVEGQKYLDNALDGDWSLMSNEENRGLVLRSTSASVPTKPGRTYKVTFDYQAAYDDDYSVVVGTDTATATGWKENITKTMPVAQARGAGWSLGDERGSGTKQFTFEFTAGDATTPTFFGVVKSGSGRQGNLVIDNLRVVEVGGR
ncbi:endo-alpha-N-acetylgalactosaminidase [Knoellia remsis]|uniref:Endo-alpha-N-acetylgalactosaminidase n=1 Tax=Knoellia remsis TaxID=407159 RepID=A0A2T0V0P1_9MICO|nr:endo-alpha-N-acetylgalactosaminidase family protein [Knoellia remsis]PRY63721.1 endo-alpha-N-acetylgalactosaminidase [Knoellia remsis]